MSNWLNTALFTLVAPGTVAGGLPALVLWFERKNFMPATGWITLAGWVFIAVGFAIYLWCAADFVRRGHGTPNPADPPKKLVVEGLYRWSRNPMYIGMVLVVVGEAMALGSTGVAAYAACLWAGFHLRVVFYEEPVLKRMFGAAFDDYRAAVPRWLFGFRKTVRTE
jgi:protein-S-isoprenylcysteine O-methyltransferase Ste14